MSTGIKMAKRLAKEDARYWFSRAYTARAENTAVLLNIEYNDWSDISGPKRLTPHQRHVYRVTYAHECWRLYREAGYPDKATMDRFTQIGVEMAKEQEFDPNDPKGFYCSEEQRERLAGMGITSRLHVGLVENQAEVALGWYSNGGAIW